MLDNSPEEYSTVLTREQRIKGSAFTIEDLQEDMRQLYCTMYGNKLNTDADTEIGLASNDISKIIFIDARGKRIKLISVHINTTVKISIVITVKILVIE